MEVVAPIFRKFKLSYKPIYNIQVEFFTSLKLKLVVTYKLVLK